MTIPFVCSRTIFLSFFSTGKKDEGRFLIVGGKPSGRASEFAFSQGTKALAFEKFKPNLTHAIGFHYQCDDGDFYVVTGGYDMVNHGPNEKAYLLYNGTNGDETIIETNDGYALPVYQAAVSKYQKT